MKRLMLAALAAFFTLAAAEGMAASNVNTGIEDADLVSAEWAPQFGDAVIDVGYPLDVPGPGVRWQATPTVGAGWTKIGIGDNFSIGDIYGFPVIPVSGGNFANWTGYTHYKLAVTNNSASDWVEVKPYYTTGSIGYWHQDVAWLAPGEARLLSIDLSVPGFDYGGGVPEPGPPNLATVSHFGVELGTNYGAGDNAGQHFDVTVSTIGEARLAPLPALSGPINCSGAATLDFVFSPGPSTLPLRGYELTLGASAELSFALSDVHDSGAFAGLGPHLFRVLDNGDGTLTVADALLGDTGGVGWVESFFDVFFHGAGTGDGVVTILDFKLRDLDNVDIPATTAGATVLVDCTAPATPTLDPEPEYTQGTSNTVSWSDESASGAVLYASDCARDAGFTDIVDSSGWVSNLSHAFSPLEDGQIYFYRVKAKDALDNETGWSGDVHSTQDASAPSSAVAPLPPYHNVISFPVAYSASDAMSGVADVELWVSIDGGPYASAGAYTSSPIVFTASGGGIYGFFTVGSDLVGNVEAWPDTPPDAQTIVDLEAPPALTNLVASPNNGRILVGWTPPSGGGATGVAIYRGLWHDGSGNSVYPEYDDQLGNKIPTRPASRAEAEANAEWTLAGIADPLSGTFTDTFLLPRGVYYYELFPFDAAGNDGPPTASTDRATNYWLGDIADGLGNCDAYDGYVALADINCLAGAYGTGEGDSYYDNEADVGPTDDTSPKGIPLTDSSVGFEDLMIFAMHYGQVAPKPLPQEAMPVAKLVWHRVAVGTWALALLEPCLSLKGLHLQGMIPADTPVTLTAGSLLGQQASACFLRNIDRNGLDVSLALMGEGLTIQGAGELFRVALPADVQPADLGAEARDATNAAVVVTFTATETPDLPTAYRLAQNYPNPFNPKTTLRFDLPEEQAVELVVFAADGRRVVTLIDAPLPAGFHSAVWDGRDAGGGHAASGVYFYRINAGPLQQTGRMLLLK